MAIHALRYRDREIDAAVAGIRARGLDIKDITLADFPLPTLDAKLAEIRQQIMEGRGVSLLRGILGHRPAGRYTGFTES